MRASTSSERRRSGAVAALLAAAFAAAVGTGTSLHAAESKRDLPPLRKQMLLAEPLVERAASLAGVLRSRALVLDSLRPFRHLAAHPDRQ